MFQKPEFMESVIRAEHTEHTINSKLIASLQMYAMVNMWQLGRGLTNANNKYNLQEEIVNNWNTFQVPLVKSKEIKW